MPEREKFSAQMEEKLSHLKERIDATKSRAEAKGNSYFAHYEADLAKLESKYDHARYKLTLLRKGGGDALAELRDGVESALGDLKAALTRAKDKF